MGFIEVRATGAYDYYGDYDSYHYYTRWWLKKRCITVRERCCYVTKIKGTFLHLIYDVFWV